MQHALFDTMARQSAQRCEQKLARAREEAEAIMAEAHRKANERRDDAVSRTRRELDRLADHTRDVAQAKADQEELTMRQAVSNEVLQTVTQELDRIARSDEFPAILDALLEELMRAAKGSPRVLAPEAHTDRVRQWLDAHGCRDTKVEAVRFLKDGVAAEDANRTQRITNSLSTRFAMLENQARKLCIETLFGVGAR